MFKKCKVVMLPTNEKAKILFTGNYINYNHLGYNKCKDLHNQHLYILSDDEIKEGDWYLVISEDSVRQAQLDFHLTRDFAKIIASTDSSLNIFIKGIGNLSPYYSSLPSIPQSFINYYVSEYNKGNKIEEVIVEYDSEYEDWKDNVGAIILPAILKLTPNNTIIIKAVKDSWTREEVIALHKRNCERLTNSYTSNDINWIESNL